MATLSIGAYLCLRPTAFSIPFLLSCAVLGPFFKRFGGTLPLFFVYLLSLYLPMRLYVCFPVCKVFYFHGIPNVGFVLSSSSTYMCSHSMASIIVVFSKKLFFPFKGKTREWPIRSSEDASQTSFAIAPFNTS
jgi:hypothetical protein